MNIIGKDCKKIIYFYKKEFERVEYNQKNIDNCIFEEFDCEILSELNFFDVIFYENKIEKRYYLNNYTVEEFKTYYLNKKYFMKVGFKFLIENQAEDYFKMDIGNIDSNYLNNLKICYIYKLNSFQLCLHLGNFKEDDLHELYENIARNYLNQYVD